MNSSKMLLKLIVLLSFFQGTYTAFPKNFHHEPCENLVLDKQGNNGSTVLKSIHRKHYARALSVVPPAPPPLGDLLDQDEPNKFEVKHVYKNYRSGVNSYAELTRSPEVVKEYLLELNRKLFKGNILPCSVDGPQTYNTWIKNAGDSEKRITLVDADLADIVSDIGKQESFKAYHERNMADPNNKLLPFKDNLFTTTEKYPITDIILKMDGDELHVSLERHVVQIELGMKNTEVFHFEKPIMATATESMQTGKFATFTKQQLKQIDVRTQQFWKKFLGGSTKLSTVKIGALKLDHDQYALVETEFRDKFETIITSGSCAAGGSRRRKRTGARCAFYLDTDGEIESIHPEEFLEIYEAAGEEDRRRMTNVVKNNGDRIIGTDDENMVVSRRRLNQLVHHQELTVHAELVETTGRIQDFRRWRVPIPTRASAMITAIHGEITTRMNKVRLSGTKVVYNLAKNPHITNMDKVGKKYGHLMMAKGLITGIIHNDKTALAVLGSRVGYDIVTTGSVKLGTKLFATASKLGKTTKILGKVAGPIGGMIDAGLGCWSLSKSVDRLKGATNKYDRDDAIADIVSESIDVAVGITTTVLSVAFPPAAPLILAVGFLINLVTSFVTAMFKAGNEVARINEKIPLLDFEKLNAFTSRATDIFGLREKDYIDYLVDERAANDLAVKSYLDFLQKNKQFMGVLFPSRALHYDGGCYLQKWTCPLGAWLGRPACSSMEKLGFKCDWNEPCGGRTCINEKTDFAIYDCVCKAEGERSITEFGVSHRDSTVDFRAKQTVYWERAVPGDVAAVDFKCKPSSLQYLDYRFHQSKSTSDYYCHQAIAIYRPSSELKEGQTFLVNLEDGTDSVDIDQEHDKTAYTYWMGEQGNKTFKGGNGRNDFVLNGDCKSGLLSGKLFGGPSASDSLIIAPNCAAGETINILADQYNLRNPFSKVILGNKLDLQLERIDNIIGRPNEAEIVQVLCDTRGIFLNGGASAEKPDQIAIARQRLCPVNVQTMLSNFTNFESSAVDGDVTVYVGKDMSGSKITINRPETNRHKTIVPTTTIIFTQTNSEQVIIEDPVLSKNGVSLRLQGNEEMDPLTVTYNLAARRDGTPIQYQLLFNESSAQAPGVFSSLMVPGNEKYSQTLPFMFYHNLKSTPKSNSEKIRYAGNNAIPNLFTLSASGWNVVGGAKEDTFILNTHIAELELDGGDADDVFVIGAGNTGVIKLESSSKLKSIETVIAAETAGPVEISTGCDTKAVVVKSDHINQPKIVRIGKCDTSSREQQIDAAGANIVYAEGDITGDGGVVRVLAHGTDKKPVMFELNTQGFQVPNMLVQVTVPKSRSELQVNHKGSTVGLNSFRVKLTGKDSSHIIFDLGMNVHDSDAFIASPQIQLISENAPPAQLVFQRDSLEPLAVHVIDENVKQENIWGFEGLQNLFRISGGTIRRTVYGGKVRDTFVARPTILSSLRLIGQSEGDNSLIIADEDGLANLDVAFMLNLQDGLMGLQMDGHDKQGQIEGAIHHVLGRAKHSDIIFAGCETKTISGRGGSRPDAADLILIPANENCQKGNIHDNSALDIHMEPFTTVENLAEKGVFRYFVNLTEPAANLRFTLSPTANNSHKLMFTLPPQMDDSPVPIKSMKFDKELQQMSIHASSNSAYEFKMFREDEESDYLNPKFVFASATGIYSATSQVRVNKDGYVDSTYLLSGSCYEDSNFEHTVKGFPADINNFMISINGTGYGKCGGIQGSPGARENRFWLYQIPPEVQFEITGSTEAQINTIHLDKDFHGNKSVTTYLHPDGGAIEREGIHKTLDVKWIDTYDGRGNPDSSDTVVPDCTTKQVSGVDLVKILVGTDYDCAYNLIIGMERDTRIQFEWMGDEPNEEQKENMTQFVNSKFNYRFTEPMSFEVNQSHAGILKGTVHNIYLPLDFAEMETLEFVSTGNKLLYKVGGNLYSITMMSLPDDEEQFYPQANIATNDGFTLKVGRDLSVMVTGVLQANDSSDTELLHMFQAKAKMLGVTILVQTDSGILHVGNNLNADRNVLQNVAFRDSYLGGGGALDTIYEVVKLDKDVYIETGLDEINPSNSEKTSGPYDIKQTLDLTDVITPIRLQIGRKYKPKVTQSGDDLVVTMDGYETEHPGKVVIFNGATENVRKNLQILLSNAMMEFVNSGSPDVWDLSPVDVHLERETVYSIAAEDLEAGHQIIVLDHKYGPEYQFRFSYSQNGDDLHLSDIEEFKDHRYDQQHIEMTTVIITDFYKNFGNGSEIGKAGTGDLPVEVENVILLLPGLKIKLDGRDVLLLDNESDKWDTAIEDPFPPNQTLPMLATFSSPAAPPAAPVLLAGTMMPKWMGVLHEVEDTVLDGLPFVHRNY